MEREQAFTLLVADSWHERLKAARSLGVTASADDLPLLLAARARETVSYVQRFLDSAIRRIRRDIDDARASTEENLSSSLMREVYAKAVEEVTRTILHEIEAIAGAITLAASREVMNYDGSETKGQLDRLGKQLEAITHLKTAASTPKNVRFSLGHWIRDLVAEEGAAVRVEVSLVGPDNLFVEGDPNHLRLAFCNGLKNAIEATEAIPTPRAPGLPRVIISWDATDVECWIAIKDDGPGISSEANEPLPVGRSTKAGHPGMGLLIAKQAMDSLQGSISLSPSTQGGAVFELRWFGK